LAAAVQAVSWAVAGIVLVGTLVLGLVVLAGGVSVGAHVFALLLAVGLRVPLLRSKFGLTRLAAALTTGIGDTYTLLNRPGLAAAIGTEPPPGGQAQASANHVPPKGDERG
jgi:hypothetical protein